MCARVQKSIADLRTAAHCIETASCQILTSTRWSIVCREVLAIGNIMNSGTARGSAHGVRLASLLKLADIKVRVPVNLLPCFLFHVEIFAFMNLYCL